MMRRQMSMGFQTSMGCQMSMGRRYEDVDTRIVYALTCTR